MIIIVGLVLLIFVPVTLRLMIEGVRIFLEVLVLTFWVIVHLLALFREWREERKTVPATRPRNEYDWHPRLEALPEESDPPSIPRPKSAPQARKRNAVANQWLANGDAVGVVNLRTGEVYEPAPDEDD